MVHRNARKGVRLLRQPVAGLTLVQRPVDQPYILDQVATGRPLQRTDATLHGARRVHVGVEPLAFPSGDPLQLPRQVNGRWRHRGLARGDVPTFAGKALDVDWRGSAQPFAGDVTVGSQGPAAWRSGRRSIELRDIACHEASPLMARFSAWRNRMTQRIHAPLQLHMTRCMMGGDCWLA